ncbi:biotin-dependent carboxyltransferase family protein [Vibrio sp. S4M6]|uniref:5-oxoprolinase subunit C family protein n=1 Tax=Vibrio sinus TaxID=2946865 RepID=UPI002029FDA9|nr:biotin-dependent carboxyltransferase family protein [Vibrio sinus]MCL9783203.1 biotin-dependent carboxyltransferase family protein [Vibrio sinus]
MKNSNHGLRVIKPGPLTLTQDIGRFGFTHIGVTQGGAIDDYSFSWANHLLGNAPNTSCLEITLGQVEFEVLLDCMLAICGGDLSAQLDNCLLNNWSTFHARKGQFLSFKLPKNGLRSYLAVKGGFRFPQQLNSSACVSKDHLGGLQQNGQAIAEHDLIEFCSRSKQIIEKPTQLTFKFRPDYNLPITLRVIESYQVSQFDDQSLQAIYSQPFTVDQHSNRMGYRLSCSQAITVPNEPILSEGITLGAIQLPPDGQPIVLLNDRQTLGGYPKIGCVARIDLPRLAQAKPGQTIRFVKGDLNELQKTWCQWANFFGY